MTDFQEPSPTASPIVADRIIPSRHRAGLRWFVSEFVVVVAGILVALGLQAWWQDRQDAARSTEYLQQILSDVLVTERALRESILIDRSHHSTTKLLSTALYASANPSRSQALQWLESASGWTADPRLVLGSVNALIQTGEIRLVSNPSARRAIVAYASIMERSMYDRDAQAERMIRANDLAFERLEAAGVPPLFATASATGTYNPIDLEDYLPAYLAAWPRLGADEQFRTAQVWRLFAYSNIEHYNQEMLVATTELRKRLEASSPQVPISQENHARPSPPPGPSG